MVDANIIEQLYRENMELLAVLDRHGEISLRTSVDAGFRKVLVRSVASYCETQITTMITTLCDAVTNGHSEVNALIRNKALKRQYHTFFNWDAQNANQFLGMFGDTFRDTALDAIRGGNL